MNLKDALHALFEHYASKPTEDSREQSMMDAMQFSKLLKEAPNLEFLNRSDLDLVFNKAKTMRSRKLYFANFLQGLLELGMMVYPDDDPTTAIAKLLTTQILGLFQQASVPDSPMIIDKVKAELIALTS